MSKDIAKGEALSNDNIAILRPNGGAHPKYLPKILNKRAKRALKAAQPLQLSDIK